MMQRVDNPEQDISTAWRKFSEVWAVASRNSLYRILAISVALGARQRAKSSSQAPLYVLGWGGEGGDCYCELPRIPLPRTWVNRLASWALTNRPTKRISMGDNCIARMPNSRVAPGGGDPHGPSLRGPRGESLELAWPSSSVGLNSFGPNPTANLVGDKERGHSGPSGSVLGEPAPDRAARGGQP